MFHDEGTMGSEDHVRHIRNLHLNARKPVLLDIDKDKFIEIHARVGF